ncbi:MAG: SRPBCC domain-containing protein [Thermoplasmata archaeon]|nr:SRPBCC domain-containing protein [Thermoplasmata archaeon]
MIEPIRTSVSVRRPPADAFRVFTREMARWWPLETHSLAADSFEGRVKAESIVFEERAGGRVYEVMSDGTEGTWATVLAWEPPSRLVLAWKPNLTDNPPTEVEIRFSPDGDGTRVELEHRGWERLGELAERARGAYGGGGGWGGVLARFVSAAESEKEEG